MIVFLIYCSLTKEIKSWIIDIHIWGWSPIHFHKDLYPS